MKKLIIIVSIMAVVLLASLGVTKVLKSDDTGKQDEFTIVTSFYPTYIAVRNIADGIDGVKVVNLTENHSGCLHDYQLTTNDMRKLESADVFVLNGGGMESFLEDVVAKYPDLKIIDAGEGIEMLEPTEEHEHEHDEDVEHEDAHDEEDEEHDHEHETNAHVWMNPVLYEKQLENIAAGLERVNAVNKEVYDKNKDSYLAKVAQIKEQLDDLKVEKGQEVIIFHEAFAYLFDYIGDEVIYCLDLDDESGLSAGEIATVIDEVKEHGVTALVTETQYKDSIADNIASETGSKVYVMDSLTAADDSKDAYINGMQENINVLKGMLEN